MKLHVSDIIGFLDSSFPALSKNGSPKCNEIAIKVHPDWGKEGVWRSTSCEVLKCLIILLI